MTVGLLTACGSDGYRPAGPFRPVPEGAPPEVGPPSSSAPMPRDPAQPGAGEDGGDPNVVASGLAVPTGLVLLPDGSAVVGERDTGRLVQVFADRSPARELMTVPGIDPSGDGGLLGLAVSPTFLEDGLFYAYVSTATDNRVVRFPLGGTPNPVLTGIPRGERHNGGGLVFAPDGTLFVGTGDVGDPALARDPNSLAGKVLHIDVFGRAVGGTPVHTVGHRDVTALCQSVQSGGTGAPGEESAPATTLYATDDAAQGPDAVDLVTAGADYSVVPPLVEIPAEEGGPGGCAAAGGAIFVGTLDGQRVHAFALDGTGAVVGEPEEFLVGQYGRLRTVVPDPEGALWITTSNRDGIGTPVEADDRVLRILPPSAAGTSPL
ncbi:Glucose/arabinose dehydrogenase, beta-propeller fold [Blastococcus tunisiensis]|uniref:Glucose/arabinose dehydrogenase, beta-propeller fold n=2 Tax=Blastococcus tunisiensis TaxID=1798228 RepID=A0A1I2CT53_9ACTN|nr:Glucose/arabinose dehydrogenase, beta-propeller fold [Blastococcus sp. DSM 46838]